MTLTVTHPFVSTVPEDATSGVAGGPVGPTEWNAGHTVSLPNNNIIVGNASNVGTGITFSAALDQVFCGTAGAFPVRAAGGWQCSTVAGSTATINTSLTAPLIYGGTAPGSNLQLQSTSSGSPAVDAIVYVGSTHFFQNAFGLTTQPVMKFIDNSTDLSGGWDLEFFVNDSGGNQRLGVIINAAGLLNTSPTAWVSNADFLAYGVGPAIATNNTTAAGNNTLHFASLPNWLNTAEGPFTISNLTTPSSIPTGTIVSSVTSTTVVMSNNAAGAGVGNGDQITFTGITGRVSLVATLSTTQLGGWVPDLDNAYALGWATQRWADVQSVLGHFTEVDLGINTTTAGLLKIFGGTSGNLQIITQAAAGTPVWTAGTSSGTPAVTASAPLSLTAATGNIVITGAAGQVLAGATPAFTATPTLGASGTLGSVTLGNATSGTLTLQPQAGAISGTVLIPTGSDTLVNLTGSQELTNKTLTSSVGKGTWTASGTWTLPAYTLGGTISGGGNQINNVIIGTVTPLAGSFTTVAASTSVTVTSASANALAAGRQGATQPAFKVDASTASQTAGLNVKGAALNGTVAVAVIDTSGNTNLSIDALGSGTIGIGSISTGLVTITPSTTISGSLLTVTTGNVALAQTTSSSTGIVTKAGLAFIHNFYDGNSTNTNTFVGLNSGNTTLHWDGSHTYTGAGNVGIAGNTLAALTTGYNNIAIGYNAGVAITSGIGNAAIGSGALATVTTGNNNVAIGNSALVTTTGGTNTAIGSAAGLLISSGGGNTIIGSSVASTTLTTGSNNILIGYDGTVDTAAAGTSNTLNIGGLITGTVLGTLASQVTSFPGTLAATSSTIGAVTITGGLAVAKQIYGGDVIYSSKSSPILGSKTTITGGGTANAPTLTAGPVTGNPTKWLPYDDNGTTRYIPAW